MTGADLLETVSTSTGHLWGIPFNPATLAASLVAASVVVGTGLWVRGRVAVAKPGRLQLVAETLLVAAEDHVSSATGRRHSAAAPLAVSLFLFILVANTVRLIPGGSGVLPNPTADLNLTAALALIAAAVAHGAALRHRGLRGYLRHYLQPFWWLLPINILSELIRPLTLALRLFATAFAGALVVALIGELIPAPISPLPHVVWGLFEFGVGAMQAAIFALLSLFYYEFAVGPPSVAVDDGPAAPETVDSKPKGAQWPSSASTPP